jgi:hypothetical protein
VIAVHIFRVIPIPLGTKTNRRAAAKSENSFIFPANCFGTYFAKLLVAACILENLAMSNRAGG